MTRIEDSSKTPAATPPGELNVRVVRPLVGYVAERLGEDVLSEVAQAAGTSRAELEASSNWLAVDEVARFMELVRDRLEDDREFKRACVHNVHESYGPMRLLLKAASPGLLYQGMARTMGHVSRVSRFEVVSRSRDSAVMRYTTERPETRLLCMSRQAQLALIPRIWNLPPAALRETSCVAWGDPCCTYELRWQSELRWGRVALMAVVTAIAAFALRTHVEPALVAGTGAALAFAVVAWEFRRMHRAAVEQIAESRVDHEAVYAQYESATRELLDLHEEQQRWNEALERRIGERTERLEGIVKRLDAARRDEQTTVLSVSHDLRNALTILQVSTELISQELGPEHADLQPTLGDMLDAVGSLDGMLHELIEFARASTERRSLHLSSVLVDDIVERARRRLGALLVGRDVRLSVFRTRDAPERVTTDRLTLLRIVDNLLTNSTASVDGSRSSPATASARPSGSTCRTPRG